MLHLTYEYFSTFYPTSPENVSQFLYDLISPHITKRGVVFDSCVGAGSLLKPFEKNGYKVLGVDIEHQGFPKTMVKNYLEIKKGEIKNVSLVIMNPPFNIDSKTKKYIKENYGGRPLLPEIWFQKAVELFGKNIPVVMFTPYGFRLNQTENSKRWLKFADGEYPTITSIISLPKDVFENILFHSEVLCFNLPKLKGHYFLDRRETETTDKAETKVPLLKKREGGKLYTHSHRAPKKIAILHTSE